MAERQILFDAIGVGWIDERHLAQRAAATGIFGLEQMPASGAPAQDFACGGNLETFSHCFPGFDAFRASHVESCFCKCFTSVIANRSVVGADVGK